MLSRNSRRHNSRAAARLSAYAFALCLAALAACAAPPAAAPPAGAPAAPVYEIVAQDVATSGGSDEPITLAISGQQAMAGAADGLPPVVNEALRAAAEENPDALYVVVYTGVKPSGGYAVTIDAMHAPDSASLLVVYSESEPGGAAAAVLTYPYVIARVISPVVAPNAVQFQRAP